MKKDRSLFLVLTLAALLLAACSTKAQDSQADPAADTPAGLISEGRLLPVEGLDQVFGAGGQVAEVLVQNGDTVNAGQPLARLSDLPEAQAALARAQVEALAAQQALDALQRGAGLALAQADLDYQAALEEADKAGDRYEISDTAENKAELDVAQARLQLAADHLQLLKEADGLDPDLLAAAQARLAAASAGVASAQALVDAQALTATIAGTVVDVSIQPGQQVAAGSPGMAVADFSSWIVRTEDLRETEVVGITPGQAVLVELDALPGLPLPGEVVNINPRFEEKRGDITYTVTIRLLESDPRMLWGMTAVVTFQPQDLP